MRGVAVLAAGLAAVGVTAAGLSGCGAAPARELERDPSRSAAIQISVFLQPDATGAQQSAVEAELRAAPGIREITFVSGEEAYELFQELFADQPELVESVRPGDIPGSFQATLPGRASAESVAVTLRRLAGVDAVIVPPPVPSSPAAVPTS